MNGRSNDVVKSRAYGRMNERMNDVDTQKLDGQIIESFSNIGRRIQRR